MERDGSVKGIRLLILKASSPGSHKGVSGKLRQVLEADVVEEEAMGTVGRGAWAARDPPRVTSLGPVGPLPKWAELPGKEGVASGVLTERFPTSSLNMPSQRPLRRAVK